MQVNFTSINVERRFWDFSWPLCPLNTGCLLNTGFAYNLLIHTLRNFFPAYNTFLATTHTPARTEVL